MHKDEKSTNMGIVKNSKIMPNSPIIKEKNRLAASRSLPSLSYTEYILMDHEVKMGM